MSSEAEEMRANALRWLYLAEVEWNEQKDGGLSSPAALIAQGYATLAVSLEAGS